MTTSGAPRPSRWHLRTVAGAVSLMVAGNFTFFSTTILLPELAAHLGVELSQVMLYPSLQGLAGVFAMTFLAPRIYRRLGVRSAIVVGGIWMSASVASVAFADTIPLLYVAGFASGLAFGMVTTMAASLLINTWFEHRRGTMMGAVFALAGLGGITAGLVMPGVVSTWGHQTGFLILAVVLLAMVVLPGLLVIRSEPAEVGLGPLAAAPHRSDEPASHRPAAGTLPGVPAGMVFRSPLFYALVISIVMFGLAGSLQQHFPPMFVDRGVTLAVAGSLISLMALTTVFTNMAIGTLNDRKGTVTAVLLAFSCQTAAMLTFAAATGFVPLAAGIVAFAVGMGFGMVLLPITVMQMFGPRDYATILGPVMATMPAGMAIGAPLWGTVASASGSYTLPLLISAGITATAALLLVWAVRKAPVMRRRVAAALAEPSE